MLYQRRFFDEDFSETANLPAKVLGQSTNRHPKTLSLTIGLATGEDDVWISGYLARNGIARIHLSLDRQGRGMATPIAIGALGSGSGVDSLSWHQPDKRRGEVLSLLRRKYATFLPSNQHAQKCFGMGCEWRFKSAQCECTTRDDKIEL